MTCTYYQKNKVRRDSMDQQVGSGSLCFAKAPFIIGTASVDGTKEREGPLADAFA